MMTTPIHVMQIAKTYPSGNELWICPDCGRRIVVTWSPRYETLVGIPGDETANHVGGKGGLQITGMRVEQADG